MCKLSASLHPHTSHTTPSLAAAAAAAAAAGARHFNSLRAAVQGVGMQGRYVPALSVQNVATACYTSNGQATIIVFMGEFTACVQSARLMLCCGAVHDWTGFVLCSGHAGQVVLCCTGC